MPLYEFRDLAAFGLHLVPSDDSVVLSNQSEKAIVGLVYVRRYTMPDGTSRTGHHSNLGSSMQLDILTGRSPAPRDLNTCILPGSKRLITERGMFGDNSDVLSPDEVHQGRGCGSIGTGIAKHYQHADTAALYLDLAIFEDGLCAGPDESGLYGALTESLNIQRLTAESAATALRNGASEGQIFELLRPIARRSQHSHDQHQRTFLPMFAHMAISQLINASPADLLAWFDSYAQPPSLTLRRAA